MQQTVLLITPPFTQPNTPYPATPQLAGFLASRGYAVFQADLGIELMHKIFSQGGLARIFSQARTGEKRSPSAQRILANEEAYLGTVTDVMRFLMYRDNTLAQLICSGSFLPQGSRFDQLPDLDWSFGALGISDRARFLATLYLEDLADLIKEAITPFFGFSRYAEKLGLSAHSFAPLAETLAKPENLLDTWLLGLLEEHIDRRRPEVVGLTIPFPGNLYGALRCGQWIKRNRTGITAIAGGGYLNTELRSLTDPAVFDHLDMITLDDGELPFLSILEFLGGKRKEEELCRTFLRSGGRVKYRDHQERDIGPDAAGCPDYTGLPLERYLSLIELANPMHRLWSDGRWNKLTLAHGCYWHKCSFCDTSLDYIRRCDHAPAAVLADRMERIAAQTGQKGFHFVDEAAPPGLLRDLALELLRRRMGASWWVNLRFEPAFTGDLCRLLAAAGCIAVTGGLETASDRLLRLMQKGVSVRQAARACGSFTDAGIMVHAYLMYGFPTETAQETVDSLETVRQFFQEGLIQSAFWHRFTATVHSDVGRNPEKYGCRIAALPSGGFAQNDLVHEDPAGCDHERFSPGLHKAVYNFMHGIGIDFPVADWFSFPVPKPTVGRNAVAKDLQEKRSPDREGLGLRVVWLGNMPLLTEGKTTKRGRQGETELLFTNRSDEFSLSLDRETAAWLVKQLEQASAGASGRSTLGDWRSSYEEEVTGPPFESLLRSKTWQRLRAGGLLLL